MNKTLLTLTVLVSLAGSAVSAQEAKIPTGIDVSGCTFYVVDDVTGKVVQICDATTNPKRLIDTQNVNSPVNNTGGTGE